MAVFTLAFWLGYALERAIKTVAQTALAQLGAGAIGVLDVNWATLASVSALAGLVSILTSVVGYEKPAHAGGAHAREAEPAEPVRMIDLNDI